VAKRGDQAKIIQGAGAQFASEPMHDLHRFLDELLRGGDFLLKVPGVEFGARLQACYPVGLHPIQSRSERAYIPPTAGRFRNIRLETGAKVSS